MNTYLLVALGGGLGASARYGLSQLALRLHLTGWPVATFTANLLGSFLMGLIAGLLTYRGELVPGGQATRLFLTTGLLGGFTTFSAFSLEVLRFIEAGQWSRAGSYAAGSVVLGVGALALGLMLARRVFA